MKPTVSKGVYYFSRYETARAFAERNGLPTDRIISYQKGWAIQREKSGPYYGPKGWSGYRDEFYGHGRFSGIGLGGETEIRELDLYLDNDEPLYKRKSYFYLNLARKVRGGRYDRAKAPKLFRYLTDEAARKYTKEFGTPGDRIFSTADRQALAESLAREFEKYAIACLEGEEWGCNDLGDEAAAELAKIKPGDRARAAAQLRTH